MTPTILSLGVTSVQAPLGIVMLGLLILFTALFLAFVVYSKTSGFFRERNHAQKMRETQELADNAETSRFTELSGQIDEELKRQAKHSSESTAKVLARLDRIDGVLRDATEGMRLDSSATKNQVQ